MRKEWDVMEGNTRKMTIMMMLNDFTDTESKVNWKGVSLVKMVKVSWFDEIVCVQCFLNLQSFIVQSQRWHIIIFKKLLWLTVDYLHIEETQSCITIHQSFLQTPEETLFSRQMLHCVHQRVAKSVT